MNESINGGNISDVGGSCGGCGTEEVSTTSPSRGVLHRTNTTLSKYDYAANRSDSLVEGLLGEIYDRFNVTSRDNLESDVFTELSISSSRFSGCDSTMDQECETCFYSKYYSMAKSNLMAFSNENF